MQNMIKFDQNIFSWFNSFVGQNEVFDQIIKFFAVYLIYLVPILFIFFWFWKRNQKTQKFLLELFLTSVVSWQVIARIIGMVVNRPRPSTFAGAREIIFHPPTYAFPSDHALFLAFLTTYLYLSGYKKIGNLALAATIIISMSRIIVGFHWPADILAGWILGIILAYAFYLIKDKLEKYIINPLWDLLKKIKLT